ncbi:serine/threonine-protein kinase [Nocardia sp. NPDC047648]|uniref:serine/threonine-protein kinase n=1 Tax=Nocardia sp. NPDC047648 TaxID=3155625 RepID=UPI0033DFD300
MTDELVAGKRLLAGRYRIDGLLGSGGMSEVFYGWDERLDRKVAIKLLKSPSGEVPSGPVSPEAVEILESLERDRKRFVREIRTTARLELTGTPAVYDTGVETRADGTTQLWLVMQLLRGKTLQTMLDHTDFVDSQPSIAWGASIAAQIAAVLSEVHQVDIVHRDIKPANVMIVDGGLVKLLDFGIAILHGSGALPRLTQIDRTVGTPPYMSPEQWLGQMVTSASDIYSLGCLLFELLTGDLPFLGVDGAVRSQHLQSSVPSVRSRRPEIPPDLDVLVTAMLDKDATKRPSALTVYGTLLPFAMVADDGRAGSQDPDPTGPFRRPLVNSIAVAASTTSGAELTNGEVRQLWDDIDLALKEDRPSQAVSLLEDGVARAGHDPALALMLRKELAAALYVCGEFGRAAALFDEVGEQYRRLRPPSDPDVLSCAIQAGHAYAQIGKAEKALPQLLFFVRNAAAGDSDQLHVVLETRFVIAQLRAATGRVDEALGDFDALRPDLVSAFGAASTHVRNLDKQAKRLRQAGKGTW